MRAWERVVQQAAVPVAVAVAVVFVFVFVVAVVVVVTVVVDDGIATAVAPVDT